MTLETPLNIGDVLYVHYVRESQLDPVCGACEGAKTFSVRHADGETRELPCGRCAGRGKLPGGASQPVLDVIRMKVDRVVVSVDRWGCEVSYFGEAESRKARAPSFRLDRIPANLVEAGALRISISTGAYLPYGWIDRKAALAVVPAWQEELQSFFAKRRRE